LTVDQHYLAGGTGVTCVECFKRNFSELAYQYLRDIPRDELPGCFHVLITCNKSLCFVCRW